MIAYHKTLGQFYYDVRTNHIEDEIITAMGRNVSDSERRSFSNSLPRIKDVLELCDLPEDVEVALEYRIPLTDRRVDFMIAGSDENGLRRLQFPPKPDEAVIRTIVRFFCHGLYASLTTLIRFWI